MKDPKRAFALFIATEKEKSGNGKQEGKEKRRVEE